MVEGEAGEEVEVFGAVRDYEEALRIQATLSRRGR